MYIKKKKQSFKILQKKKMKIGLLVYMYIRDFIHAVAVNL